MIRPALLVTASLLCSTTCGALARPVAPPTPATPVAPFAAALGELAPAGPFHVWLEQLPGFTFSPATARLLRQEFGTARLFSVTTGSATPGTRDYTVRVPALRHTAARGLTYMWPQMQATFTVQQDDGTIIGTGHAPRLSMRHKNRGIVLDHIAFSSKGRRGASGFFNGDLGGSIDKLTLGSKEDGGPMMIGKLALAASVTEQAGNLGLRFEGSIGTFRFQNLKLDDIKIAAHIDNVDAEAIQVFRQMTASFSPAESMVAAARSELMEPLWEALVTRLASKGAVVELENFQIGYKGNIAHMHGYYRFENIQPGDFSNAAILEKKMVSRVEVRVPLAMARAINVAVSGKKQKALPRGADAATIASADRAYVSEALLAPIAMGLVRIDGDMLVSTVDMRDGIVLLNGKRMTPPDGEDAQADVAVPAAETVNAKDD
jgi:uncharacterized protein YdgA (DUF945 family)